MSSTSGAIVYIPHGGGPMPLLGEPSHQPLVDFLRILPEQLITPSAIVLISAHWEEQITTITSGHAPELIYDYYGFPQAAYQIKYSAPGHPALAEQILQLFQTNGVTAQLNAKRGFDHGLFVPLTLMYPAANIPCLQISLVNTLDPATHIQMGKALTAFKKERILIIGSGFSFHNMPAFFAKDDAADNAKIKHFTDNLINICTDQSLSEVIREQQLINWSQLDYARFCQPREEHLLPLHVCYGIAQTPAKLIFANQVFGKLACGLMW